MTARTSRRLTATIAASTVAAALLTVTGDPAVAGTVPAPPGCAEVTAFLDTGVGVIVAVSGGDLTPVGSLLAQWPDQAVAAQSVAPPELAEPLSTLGTAIDGVVAAADGVDLSAPSAAETLFEAMSADAAADPAFEAVAAWATEQCGWSELGGAATGAVPQAAEPAPCELLNPVVAADAAELDVNLGASQVSADVNLGALWIKGCGYAGGALALSSIQVADGSDAGATLIDNTPGAAIIEGVELGSLPASTLVYATGVEATEATDATGTAVGATTPAASASAGVTVAVIEAPVPFLVAVTGGDVDPTAVVAAAEALLATLPASLSVPTD